MTEKLLFPSEKWILEYCNMLTNSHEYNKAGKGWKDPILFKISDAEKLTPPLEHPTFILYLKDGICEKAEFFEEEEQRVPFILAATYNNWKKVINGKIGPTQAMLMGQIKVKGNMALLLRYATAAIAMVKAAQNIPTRYME